jgi:hypothetical protein
MSASFGEYPGGQEEAGQDVYIDGGVATQEGRNITPGVRDVVTDQD